MRLICFAILTSQTSYWNPPPNVFLLSSLINSLCLYSAITPRKYPTVFEINSCPKEPVTLRINTLGIYYTHLILIAVRQQSILVHDFQFDTDIFTIIIFEWTCLNNLFFILSFCQIFYNSLQCRLQSALNHTA